MNADEAEMMLKGAADKLTVITSHGEIKSIDFYATAPASGKITVLPKKIDGYDVEIAWGEIETTSLGQYGISVINDTVTATISCPWTNKAEIRTFKTAYWKGM